MKNLIDKNVIVRTITHYYTGRLAAIEDGMLVLADAAWIADTGRWSECLAQGSLSEVEPYPGTVYVAVHAVVDCSQWSHDLPRKVR